MICICTVIIWKRDAIETRLVEQQNIMLPDCTQLIMFQFKLWPTYVFLVWIWGSSWLQAELFASSIPIQNSLRQLYRLEPFPYNTEEMRDSRICQKESLVFWNRDIIHDPRRRWRWGWWWLWNWWWEANSRDRDYSTMLCTPFPLHNNNKKLSPLY